MILTVTLNAALDVTYQVPALRPGHAHRVGQVITRAGGKGINVARVLHTLGEHVIVCGLAGGATGAELTALLAAEAISADLTPITGQSRRTVVVHDGQQATGLWEPGPTVLPTEWATFLDGFRTWARQATVVVLSGSLPPGLPDDSYRQLAVIAKNAGAWVLLDADRHALRHGLTAEPDLIKPNATELAEITGLPTATHAQALHAAQVLRAGRRTAVVASLGPAGLAAYTGDGAYTAVVPEPVAGNPTGAGDAVVAALAAGVAHDRPWPVLLTDAVAISAAAVAAPAAGEFCASTATRLRAAVTVTRAEIAATGDPHRGAPEHATDTHR
ncbi:1-phosphofructokinase family hexose kinase [Micromonospora sp. SL1-18]|uniref:1-phosphofructokinase family hexose kinase n=1 Tax=Micromonospora sp. SL1-18 TaxID=3399128 RepID=UPI003A4D6267